ncbi:MAG: SoxR reducing system RseC family protein [Gammaproteobacteria bacterium]|nr:SoxR reducing system RseC family protein [Gammaproteobacteria bacterium]
MENPRGRIISVKRVDTSLQALVEVDASISCRRCREGKGCGAGLFGSDAQSRRFEALIGEGLDVQEGDDVRVELAPANLLQASLIVYGMPLFGAILGAVFAYLAGLAELYAAVAALGGIVAGFVVARRRLQRASRLTRFMPTIVERLSFDGSSVSQQPAAR